MPALISKLIPASRNNRAAAAISLVTAICLHDTSAQDIIGKESGKKSKGAFPTLSILPEGSILRRVRLPRYDKNFKPTSLLAAEQLTVLDSHRIEGEGVTIELYEQDGSLQARSKMRRAIYDQKNSVINAKEAVYLKGKNYVASGSGLVFHWESKQGFLDGPASTRFHFKKDTAMNLPSSFNPRRNQQQMCSLLGSFLILNTTLIAEPPARLTEAQLAELERLSKPTTVLADESRSDVQERIQNQAKLSEGANSHIKPFLKSIGKDTLLIQNPAEPTPPVKEVPPAKKPDPKDKESTLLVECDGGLYFDNETGILAYLKNIRLTEDRFKLTCSKELKVFLEKKPTEDKKDGKKDNKEAASDSNDKADTVTTDKKDKKEKEDKEDKRLSAFGDLKQIIATGEVKVTRLDDQGRPFVAMSETASYDAKTGEIILSGGRPRLQQSAKQYLQAQEDGQWVRVLKSGKLVTSAGKWKMVAIVKNR